MGRHVTRRPYVEHLRPFREACNQMTLDSPDVVTRPGTRRAMESNTRKIVITRRTGNPAEWSMTYLTVHSMHTLPPTTLNLVYCVVDAYYSQPVDK